MVDLIRWLKHRNTIDTSVDADALSGFVYVAAGEPGPMTLASAGARVENSDDGPPWIVVDHKLESTILAKWPGRVWRVRVLRRAPEQPHAYAGYTRATAVQVEEELPLAALFDFNGLEVAEFLSAVSQITGEAKESLSTTADGQAARLHSEVWDRWLSQADPSSPYLGEDHSGILSMGAKAPRSPVGNAPSVLHAEVRKRAREIDGESAFELHEDEESLNPQWACLAAHLQHALFAIGASDSLLTQAEREVLARAYSASRLPQEQGDAA